MIGVHDEVISCFEHRNSRGSIAAALLTGNDLDKMTVRAALRQRDRTQGCRPQWQNILERAPGIREAVQEENWRPIRVAMFDEGNSIPSRIVTEAGAVLVLSSIVVSLSSGYGGRGSPTSLDGLENDWTRRGEARRERQWWIRNTDSDRPWRPSPSGTGRDRRCLPLPR
ncbi:hypothetical protein J2W42_005506 [Rhizobium tibeticum]|nr:hypothetical protein [Rhizobium tibeticum]